MNGVFKDPNVIPSANWCEEKDCESIKFLFLLSQDFLNKWKFSLYYSNRALGSLQTPAIIPRLVSMCMEAHYWNYIFSNNHRVSEDYEKYWHLRDTD